MLPELNYHLFHVSGLGNSVRHAWWIITLAIDLMHSLENVGVHNVLHGTTQYAFLR